MRKEHTTRVSHNALSDAEGSSDWKRLIQEETVGVEPAYDADIDEVDWDFATASVVMPQPKKAISVRLDAEVLDFFKSQGKGYQTRINAVLRSYMEAKKNA